MDKEVPIKIWIFSGEDENKKIIKVINRSNVKFIKKK
jgi:hypothetical protein